MFGFSAIAGIAG